MVTLFQHNAFEIAHVVLQATDTLLSASLRLSEFLDALLGTLLRLGQVAHYLGERQQLLGQHEPAEFCPPLGVLLKNPDEIVEILDRESHNVSTLGRGNRLKAQQGNESILYGHSPRQVWPAWQVLQSCRSAERATTAQACVYRAVRLKPNP